MVAPLFQSLVVVAWGVWLCKLLPSMLINGIISLYIHPHSPTFAETISAEIHLMPPPAFTAVISVPPGQSSSSSAEVCTALLHLSQVQGTPGSLPKRWSPRLGMPDSTLAGIEAQGQAAQPPWQRVGPPGTGGPATAPQQPTGSAFITLGGAPRPTSVKADAPRCRETRATSAPPQALVYNFAAHLCHRL